MNNCLLKPKSRQPICPNAPKKQYYATRIDEQSIRSVCRVLFADEPKSQITSKETA